MKIPCSKRQGIFDRKEISHFHIRSLTPQQVTELAHAIAVQDPDLARVEAALLRAGAKAREIARQTSTPLIIYKDGKIRYRIYNENIS
ncbi:MAG: hypothetical protein QME06_00210 [Desulfobacterales bacterium]|nr:hypothetical protein [Desulfobacterales bacterium]